VDRRGPTRSPQLSPGITPSPATYCVSRIERDNLDRHEIGKRTDRRDLHNASLPRHVFRNLKARPTAALYATDTPRSSVISLPDALTAKLRGESSGSAELLIHTGSTRRRICPLCVDVAKPWSVRVITQAAAARSGSLSRSTRAGQRDAARAQDVTRVGGPRTMIRD